MAGRFDFSSNKQQWYKKSLRFKTWKPSERKEVCNGFFKFTSAFSNICSLKRILRAVFGDDLFSIEKYFYYEKCQKVFCQKLFAYTFRLISQNLKSSRETLMNGRLNFKYHSVLGWETRKQFRSNSVHVSPKIWKDLRLLTMPSLNRFSLLILNSCQST